MESKHPPADMTANRPPAEKANRLHAEKANCPPAEKADRSLAEQRDPMIDVAQYFVDQGPTQDVHAGTSGAKADRPSSKINTKELLKFVLRDDDALGKCEESDVGNPIWRNPDKFKHFESVMESLYKPESNLKVSKPRSELICALPLRVLTPPHL